MRIFLTGATGFLGSHVLARLIDDGDAVAVLMRPGTDPWRVTDRLSRATAIEGTLDQPEAFAQALAAFAPDTVIHLAWSGVGNARHGDPAQDENLARTEGLLELSARLGVGAWIGIGSQAEYGPVDGAVAEDRPAAPTSAYGRAKLAASEAARGVCAGAGMRFAWLRLFAAYGPRDNPGWFLPSLILALLRGDAFAMTEGTQRHDYLFAADAARALALVAGRADAQGVFNLGAGAAARVRDIAEKTRDLIDPALPLGIGKLPLAADAPKRVEADVTRIREAVGWAPATPLDDGLAETVAWFRDNRSRYDAPGPSTPPS